MMVVFTLHLLLAGTLAALAAWFGEGALRRIALPTRWVWVVALVLTVAVPLALLPQRAAVVVEHTTELVVVPVQGAELVGPEASGAAAWLPAIPVLSIPHSAESLALPLLVLWGLASIVAVGRLAAGHAWLRRRRATWRAARIRDSEVSISPDLGPAVVGVAPGSIVLPHWALSVSPEIQQLMLEHERQHLRSRDPWLQLAADAAVALAPWHPALHWLRRRLRVAVELDCDARVLRQMPDAAARYAELLIAVAGRSHGALPPVVGAMSLAPGLSTLERRIAAMTERRRRRPLAATVLAGAGILVAVAACEAPAIIAPAPEGEVPFSAIVDDANRLTADSVTIFSDVTTEEQVLELRVVGAVLDSLRIMGRLPVGEPVVALYDVDGVIVRGASELENLGVNPEAISSVEVMRGAAAESMGAPHGVVYIRLKDSTSTLNRVAERPVELRLQTPLQRAPRSQPSVVMRRVPPENAVGRDSLSVLIREAPAGSPLYLVDGVVVTDPDAIERLDPENIESVEILKGDAAARIYGARGANGVIQVTTKGSGGS